MTKFVCLGYADHSLFAAMQPSEMSNAMERCFAFDDELRRGGHFAGGEALQPATTAITLRLRDGKVVATDGPFAETKEQLGGILLLEANDLTHAVELMSRHPGVHFGPFEIRPADASINALIEARNRRLPQVSLEVDGLLQTFADHLGYLQAAVDSIPEPRMLEQPNGLINHPAWTLSHLNASLRFLLQLLDEPQADAQPHDFAKYGPGSIPTSDPNDYASKSELLADLARLHTTTDMAVRAKYQEYFQRESPESIRQSAPTIGRIATYLLASHEAYHLGQLNQWRRAAGIVSQA